jgi:hypothetical protein
MEKKHTYKLIIKFPVSFGRWKHIYQYITTSKELTLEHYDPIHELPARLWIGDDTYIDFEEETIELTSMESEE